MRPLISNRQYIHLGMPYNHFHAFFTSLLLLKIKLQDEALALSNVRKRLRLRCPTGFKMYQCCVRENYLSVNFPTQPFLQLSCLW